MSYSKIEQIAKRLKEEEKGFIDFKTIEERTEALGFPTPVRTLRFYISEGVLPAPKKIGKTPVYEEDWILNALLATHIMKTRLNRSLSEIRSIMQNLNEDPITLADKCSVIYEEYVKGGKLSRVEYEWLIDAFFGELSGFKRLSGLDGAPRSDWRVKQPSEVSILDIVDDIEKNGEWRKDEQGIAKWISPDQVRREKETALLRVPTSGISRQNAKDLESFFIERFENNVRSLKSVVNPLDKKLYSVKVGKDSFVRLDRRSDIIGVMRLKGIYDRVILDQMPLNLSSYLEIMGRSSGVLGRKEPKVIIEAVVLSPIADLIETGFSKSETSVTELMSLIESLIEGSRAFHFIGAFTTTKWDSHELGDGADKNNYSICLIERDDLAGWKTICKAAEVWNGLQNIFDPETEREKIDRCKNYLDNHPEFQLRGGFVDLDEVKTELAISEEVLTKAINEIVAEDDAVSVQNFDEKRILKRRRL